MGFERVSSLTAIGDTVNTASRLEALTKDFKAELVVSQELLDRAGIDLPDAPLHDVDIRGRQGKLAVRAVLHARDLTSLSS
jgi:adenylate cyclase